MAKQQGQPLPTFKPFDGSYPVDWPSGVKLPTGYLLKSPPLEMESARNEASQAAGYRSIDITGVSPLGIEGTLDWFRDQFKHAGYSTLRDERIGSTVHNLAFDRGPDPRVFQVLVKVWLDNDLGSYAYVMGAVTIDTNR
jgi:hypothetical protein